MSENNTTTPITYDVAWATGLTQAEWDSTFDEYDLAKAKKSDGTGDGPSEDQIAQIKAMYDAYEANRNARASKISEEIWGSSRNRA